MDKNLAKTFFSEEEQKNIVQVIKKVELKTSAELRLHIDTNTNLSALDRASCLFKSLGMHKTEARNGVLLYIAVQSRQFAIIGDAGIHYFVKEEFWEQCKEDVLQGFRQGKFCESITSCIEKVGENLAKYFPYQEDDKNELSDELSFN